MTSPARRNNQAIIYRLQWRQSWAVLGLVMVGCALQFFGVAHAGKSLGAGAVLAYIAQCVFTFIAYRTTHARAQKVIMLNMYLGQMMKWLITLIGFAMIFLWAKPIQAFLVILGYFAMQIIHILVMWRI